MASRQTFHTPSFGDEEFEILSTPTFDHHHHHQQQQQQQQHQQQQSLLLQRQSNVNTSELSLLSSSTSSSSPSLHSIIPVITNQSNQWQTHTITSGIPISTDSGYIGDSATMSDTTVMPNDESDIQRLSNDNTVTISGDAVATIAAVLAKNKKKREPNEPPKPISAYALFFRDTQVAIKGQNPDASFGEISKIVASMWDALDPEHKNVYKKKTELAKKEYLKSLAAYRASQLNKVEVSSDTNMEDNEIQTQNNITVVNSISNNSTFIQEDNISPSVVNVVKIARVPTQNSTTVTATQCNTQLTNPNNLGIVTSVGNNQSSAEISLKQSNNSNNNNNITPSNNETMSQNHPVNVVETNQQLQKCIREGCNNKAIVNSDWEDEYCSNECVIIHCRDVFSQWVQSNNLQTA